MHMEVRDFFGRNAWRVSAMTTPTTSSIDHSKVHFPSEAVRQDNRVVSLQQPLFSKSSATLMRSFPTFACIG